MEAKSEESKISGLEGTVKLDTDKLEYVTYAGEHHLEVIMEMIKQELSEPYPVFTYRYFVDNWPELTILAYSSWKMIESS